MGIDELLKGKREEILRIAGRHGARNVRVFGSAARGEAGPDSDIDFLVGIEPGRSLLDHAALWQDLEDLLGRSVDVVEPEGLHWHIKDRILKEAGSRAPVKDDKLYLIHIQECIARIEQYV